MKDKSACRFLCRKRNIQRSHRNWGIPALLVFSFGLLFVPSAFARAASLTFGTTTISLTSPAVNFIVASDSTADLLTVNATSVLVSLSASGGNSFTLTSAQTDIQVSASAGGGTDPVTCIGTPGYGGIDKTVLAQQTGSATYTIIPHSIAPQGTDCVSIVNHSGGGGGTSGSTGGSTASTSTTASSPLQDQIAALQKALQTLQTQTQTSQVTALETTIQSYIAQAQNEISNSPTAAAPTGASVYNIKDAKYGANGTNNTIQCNSTTGSSIFTCASTSDFAAGQYVRLYAGGPPVAIARPSAPTITPSCSGWNWPNCTLPIGTSTYNYAVVAADGNSGYTQASPIMTITNGGTLHGGGPTTEFNRITWNPVAGASAYIIYKSIGVGVTPTFFDIASYGATSDNDYGQPALQGHPAFPDQLPTANVPGDLFTTINSISGNAVTLASAAGTTITSTLEHDDRVPFQAAVDDASAAGGGTVYLPPGTYNVDMCNRTPQGGLGIGINLANRNNITIAGAGPSSTVIVAKSCGWFYQLSTYNVGLFASAYAGGFAVSGYTLQPVSAIQPALLGAMSVTLARPSQANAFPVGSFVFIRTGQTLDDGNGNPDAELNEVVSSDGATGIVGLKYPLSKDYLQQYYVSGTSGRTTTSVTPNPAPLGISNVTQYTIQNIVLRDFGVSADIVTPVSQLPQAIHVRITDLWTKTGDLGGIGSDVRDYEIDHNRAVDYWEDGWGTTGTVGGKIHDNWYISTAPFNIQANEGATNIVATNNLIISPDALGGTWNNVFGARAICHNIALNNNLWLGQTGDTMVRFDAPCERVTVSGNTFWASYAVSALLVPDVSQKVCVSGNVYVSPVTGLADFGTCPNSFVSSSASSGSAGFSLSVSASSTTMTKRATSTISVTGTSTTSIAAFGERTKAPTAMLQTLTQQVKVKGIALPSGIEQFAGQRVSFIRNLFLGARGDDVYALQLFLIQKNIGSVARMLAAHGVTHLFWTLTRSALAEYQKSIGIMPARGYFGPITRTYVNGLQF